MYAGGERHRILRQSSRRPIVICSSIDQLGALDTPWLFAALG